MQRPFEVHPELYPFESRWAEVDGIRLHYVDEGPRTGAVETIVCFHGNPAWSLVYAPLIRLLRAERRCIAVDMAGFGMSAKPAPERFDYSPAEQARLLRAVLDGLGLDRFSIFVQDWGGPIGLATVGERPERVERIFLGNTWAWQYDPATAMGAAALEFSKQNGTDEARAFNVENNTIPRLSLPLLLRGIKKRAPELRGALRDAYLAPFARPADRTGSHWFPRYLMQAPAFFDDLAARLPALVRKPAILFWGEQDPIFTAGVRVQWEALLEQGRTVLLSGASHYFMEEEAERVAAEIRRGFE